MLKNAFTGGTHDAPLPLVDWGGRGGDTPLHPSPYPNPCGASTLAPSALVTGRLWRLDPPTFGDRQSVTPPTVFFWQIESWAHAHPAPTALCHGIPADPVFGGSGRWRTDSLCPPWLQSLATLLGAISQALLVDRYSYSFSFHYYLLTVTKPFKIWLIKNFRVNEM